MGYQLTGLEGTVTSWGSGASDWGNHLTQTATAPSTFSLEVDAPEIDVTALGGSGANLSHRTGLQAWRVRGESFWPRSTRIIGAQGLVTFAAGYVLNLRSWSLAMEWSALDTTAMGASGVTYRTFRPSFRGKFTGAFRGYVDSATTPVVPTLWTGSSAAATLKLAENGTNDNSFTGNIVATGLGVSVPINGGGLQEYDYRFAVDGALTVVSDSGNGTTTFGTNILPGSTTGLALGTPTWDNDGDGVADRTLLLTLASGRTYSGAAFLTSVSVSCEVDQPIRVQWVAQGSGPLTVA